MFLYCLSFSRIAACFIHSALCHCGLLTLWYSKSNRAPIRIDGHPRVSGILDTIKVCQAHGIPVPAEFNDPVVMEKLERAVVGEWYVCIALKPTLTSVILFCFRSLFFSIALDHSHVITSSGIHTDTYAK